MKKKRERGFPGGPVVTTQAFTAVDRGLIPGQETKIPQAAARLKGKKIIKVAFI